MAFHHAVAVDGLARVADDALAQLAELGGLGRTVEERVDVVARVLFGLFVAIQHPGAPLRVRSRIGPPSRSRQATLAVAPARYR
jgi:hypothetical protein